MMTDLIRGLDRRALLRAAGAMAALSAATSAAAQTQPRRLSLQTFSQDKQLVGALRRGVARMKALPADDPGSWWWQGAVHKYSGFGVPAFPTQGPMPTAQDQARYWNQCPHGMHEEGADDFLGWHGAYLRQFETILRDASGLPRLAVPYWDYTDAAQRTLPPIFRMKEIKVNADWEDDPSGTVQLNPLYERLRNPKLAVDGAPLADGTVDIGWFGQVGSFRAINATQGRYGFGGGHARGLTGGLEGLPHNQVHGAVGGAGLMGAPHTAAFDPIFWPHHANIDRLWRQWLCGAQRLWGAFDSQADLDGWLDAKAWWFKSPGGGEILRQRRDDVLLKTSPFTYEDGRAGCPDPALRLRPAATGGLGGQALTVGSQIKSFNTVARVAAIREPLAVRGRQPSSVTLRTAPIPMAPSSGAGGSKSVGSVLAESTPAAPNRLFLDVSGLDITGLGDFGYDVFVDLPEGAAPERSSPQFVGVLNLFGTVTQLDAEGPARAPAHADHAEVQTFDVTSAVRQTGAAQPELRVVFAPFDMVQPRPGSEAPAGALTVRNMTLRVVAGSTLPDS